MRIAVALLAVSAASAGEFAVLQNGFRIQAERHESLGELTRLHTSTGTVDVPTSQVAQFEVEEYVAPPPAPPAIVPSQKQPDPAPGEPKVLIDQAAAAHGLLPEFVHSVASVESAYRTTAVSHKGAIGLMQLMPGTAKDLGVNPHDPAQNAEAGARYLKQLLLRYKDTKDPVRLALAAYNAGPGAVDRYGNIPPYRETQAYVEKVLRRYLAQLKLRKS